jgi:hypothetical protein
LLFCQVIALTHGFEHKLDHCLILLHFEFFGVDFKQLSNHVLVTMLEGTVHHDLKDFNLRIGIDLVNHLLQDLDRLADQEVPFLWVLILQRATPRKQPTKINVELEKFVSGVVKPKLHQHFFGGSQFLHHIKIHVFALFFF